MSDPSTPNSARQTFTLRNILGGICLAVAGLLLIWGATRQLYLSRASLGWPTTRGTLTRSELVHFAILSADAYRQEFDYNYSVDGRDYTNDDLSPTRAESYSAQSEAIA
ncbi:MAG: DUF3592 domain-containing protein [bacterium]